MEPSQSEMSTVFGDPPLGMQEVANDTQSRSVADQGAEEIPAEELMMVPGGGRSEEPLKLEFSETTIAQPAAEVITPEEQNTPLRGVVRIGEISSAFVEQEHMVYYLINWNHVERLLVETMQLEYIEVLIAVVRRSVHKHGLCIERYRVWPPKESTPATLEVLQVRIAKPGEVKTDYTDQDYSKLTPAVALPNVNPLAVKEMPEEPIPRAVAVAPAPEIQARPVIEPEVIEEESVVIKQPEPVERQRPVQRVVDAQVLIKPASSQVSEPVEHPSDVSPIKEFPNSLVLEEAPQPQRQRALSVEHSTVEVNEGDDEVQEASRFHDLRQPAAVEEVQIQQHTPRTRNSPELIEEDEVEEESRAQSSVQATKAVPKPKPPRQVEELSSHEHHQFDYGSDIEELHYDVFRKQHIQQFNLDHMRKNKYGGGRYDSDEDTSAYHNQDPYRRPRKMDYSRESKNTFEPRFDERLSEDTDALEYSMIRKLNEKGQSALEKHKSHFVSRQIYSRNHSQYPVNNYSPYNTNDASLSSLYRELEKLRRTRAVPHETEKRILNVVKLFEQKNGPLREAINKLKGEKRQLTETVRNLELSVKNLQSLIRNEQDENTNPIGGAPIYGSFPGSGLLGKSFPAKESFDSLTPNHSQYGLGKNDQPSSSERPSSSSNNMEGLKVKLQHARDLLLDSKQKLIKVAEREKETKRQAILNQDKSSQQMQELIDVVRHLKDENNRLRSGRDIDIGTGRKHSEEDRKRTRSQGGVKTLDEEGVPAGKFEEHSGARARVSRTRSPSPGNALILTKEEKRVSSSRSRSASHSKRLKETRVEEHENRPSRIVRESGFLEDGKSEPRKLREEYQPREQRVDYEQKAPRRRSNSHEREKPIKTRDSEERYRRPKSRASQEREPQRQTAPIFEKVATREGRDVSKPAPPPSRSSSSSFTKTRVMEIRSKSKKAGEGTSSGLKISLSKDRQRRENYEVYDKKDFLRARSVSKKSKSRSRSQRRHSRSRQSRSRRHRRDKHRSRSRRERSRHSSRKRSKSRASTRSRRRDSRSWSPAENRVRPRRRRSSRGPRRTESELERHEIRRRESQRSRSNKRESRSRVKPETPPLSRSPSLKTARRPKFQVKLPSRDEQVPAKEIHNQIDFETENAKLEQRIKKKKQVSDAVNSGAHLKHLISPAKSGVTVSSNENENKGPQYNLRSRKRTVSVEENRKPKNMIEEIEDEPQQSSQQQAHSFTLGKRTNPQSSAQTSKKHMAENLSFSDSSKFGYDKLEKVALLMKELKFSKDDLPGIMAGLSEHSRFSSTEEQQMATSAPRTRRLVAAAGSSKQQAKEGVAPHVSTKTATKISSSSNRR